jgi:EAL domain-containing protein (putative c-di-GMP-specific phosphodiesterase class I)
VIQTACRQCAEFVRQGLGELSVSVNLSAKEVHAPQVIATVQQSLAESGIPAAALQLELTESMIMDNVVRSVDTLNALHELGVKLAIDNFGTGYSSLPQLHRLPISILKIDRQFIVAIDSSDDHVVPTTIQAMIKLAHSFGISALAQGVETSEQFSLLREQRCDLMQGWLHSPPMPADELVGFLHDYDPNSWLNSLLANPANR